jgi:hypothetical protein
MTHQKHLSNVSNWKTAGVFPASTFLVMNAELSAAGYSAPPSLWQQIEPIPSEERASA